MGEAEQCRRPQARELPERGVDGLNLAKFPLAVLADRVPNGLKTLEFNESVRRGGELIRQKVTITGSDKFGLPTSKHHDLLFAAIQLNWEKNQWADPRFEFTSYELLDKAGWDKSGYYYKLASAALSVYQGTSCFFEQAWYVDGKFRTKGFSIIDDFELYRTGAGGRGRRTKRAMLDEPSYIHWGSVVFADFQEKRTKGFDYNLYLQLRSAVSRRLYRHLDKWFHYGPEFRHPDLRVFACEKIGLSRNCRPKRLLEVLNGAAEELTQAGYLRPQPPEKRFRKQANGVYEVVFQRKPKGRSKRKPPAAASSERMPRAFEEALRERGVANAAELAARYPAERISAAIENFDDRNKHGEGKGAGWLRRAIEDEHEFGFRAGYTPKAELEAKAAREKAEREEKERRQVAESKKLRRIREQENNRWKEFMRTRDAVSEERRIALEDEALRNSEPLIAEMVLSARNRGEVGKFHQLLWEQKIIPKHFAEEGELESAENR